MSLARDISQRPTSNLLATRWAIAPRFVRQTRYSGRTNQSKTRFALETNGGARNETTYCPGSMSRGFRYCTNDRITGRIFSRPPTVTQTCSRFDY
jgi:hypothetical protein